MADGRGMQPQDVYALQGVSDPRLSPDGKTVAYVVWSIDEEASEYRGNVWFAAVDGSSPPRRFTTGEKRDGQQRWSPDGTHLAFTSSRAEKEPGQLFVLPVEGGGEAQRLTKLKEDVQDVGWSPDGTRIAFSARVRDEAYEEEEEHKRAPRRITRLLYKLDNVGWTSDRHQHVFVVPADGSAEPTQLTEGEFDHGEPAWSPDGTQLVFVAARHEDWDTDLVNDLYLISAEGGDPERLTQGDGSVGQPVWSADGSRLAFVFTKGDVRDWPYHSQIAVLDVGTRERRLLTESLDRQCGPFPTVREPVWDGDRIVFAVEDHGNVHLYAVPADGSAPPELLAGGERNLRGFDVRNGAVVTSWTTATSFPDLYVDDRQVTDTTSGFPAELVEPERFTAVSADGSEVDAWLLRPHGFEEGRSYPVLLNVHGGPFSQYGTGFFDEFQVYAGAGYAVVFCNPRGSSGYSEAWGRAIRGPADGQGPGWGTVDHQDVTAALDTALERWDFLDPERLGVMGGSYGGFMTSWIVGHTNRFKAALSERAVNNLLSAYGSSDVFWAFRGQFGALAYDAVGAYLEHSPITYAGAIETPLLIVHSENDLRCDVEQAEQLFITLRLEGKQVELVRFPGEGHELTRSGSPRHRVQRFEIVLEWFDRYLK